MADPGTHPHSPAASLTCREADILRLLAQGRSNKEIAAQLGLSASVTT